MHNLTLPYQFGFVECHSYLGNQHLEQLSALLKSRDEAEKQYITLKFEEKFAKLVGTGSASSFASGRMAFYALMEALDIKEGDEIILTAFTCSVMPNAVMKRGARPVYADMDKYTFGSHASAIQKVITARTKLIVAQHSFGIPCDIEPIIRLAKEQGIYVVEDCAIAFDSSLAGIKVGNWGDAAIFSTDHSKPINTIIGGMLYTRNPEIHKKVKYLARMSPPLSHNQQQNLYQQMLFERKHYVPNRYPHARLYSYAKKMWARILCTRHPVFLEDNYTRPTFHSENYPYPAAMPPFLAMLGLFELERWNTQKNRRKKLLSCFIEKFRQSNYSAHLPAVYNDPTRDIVPLRFVFYFAGSGELLQRLRQYIDVDWIWFRQPVTCAVDGLESMGYVNNSCLISEEICSGIINLPCNIAEEWERDLLAGVDRVLAQRTR